MATKQNKQRTVFILHNHVLILKVSKPPRRAGGQADRTGQDRAGQDRAGQDRTGQDRTGQAGQAGQAGQTGQTGQTDRQDRSFREECLTNKLVTIGLHQRFIHNIRGVNITLAILVFLTDSFENGVATETTSQGPRLVILFTYMRSGSSLVGDILQHADGAFYIYEPLRSLGARHYNNQTITFVNGSIR